MKGSYYTVTYLCPDCKIRITKEVFYPDKELFADPSEAKITVGLWCNKCSARHEFTISLQELDNGKFRVNTLLFKSNDIGYKKKLRLKPTREVNTWPATSTKSLSPDD